jgi:predicted DNA-binding transcriptional regulator AlpA
MQWLTEKQVSEITKMALPTLRNWRAKGKGFRYAKVGKSVRYAADDIQQYMAAHNVRTAQN